MKRFLITIRSKYIERAWESLSAEQKLAEARGGVETPVVDPGWEEWLASRDIRVALLTKDGKPITPLWFDSLKPGKDELEELFGEPRDLPVVTAANAYDAQQAIHPTLRHRIVSVKEVGTGG